TARLTDEKGSEFAHSLFLSRRLQTRSRARMAEGRPAGKRRGDNAPCSWCAYDVGVAASPTVKTSTMPIAT
ncbi:MAG: hypothetical protein QOF73_2826, partial [Thermomicrobiales bacterium]|nr:hypothetical protein [Thermomicrobiales bacterium]